MSSVEEEKVKNIRAEITRARGKRERTCGGGEQEGLLLALTWRPKMLLVCLADFHMFSFAWKITIRYHISENYDSFSVA